MPTVRSLAALSALALVAATAAAQNTYTWTGSTGGAWVNTGTGGNWTISGNTATVFPGLSGNTGSPNGLTSDIAQFSSVNTNTTSNVGLNFNTTSGNLSGSLSLGAISVTQTTALQIGSSSQNGILTLNGATLNSVDKTLAWASGANLTIANVNSGSGTQTMGLRLGISDGVFQAATGRTLTISSNITELTAGSGFTVRGGGTVSLSGTNTFTGTVRVLEGGLSLATVSGGSALGSSSASLQLGNTGASSGVTLTLTGGTATYAQAVTVTGTGGTKLLTSNNSSGYTFTGGLTLNDSFTIHRAGSGTANTTFSAGGIAIDTGKTLTLQTTNTSGIVLNSLISGGGGVTVTSTGTGTTTLGAANTYTGSTAVANGTLRIALGNDRLPTSTTVTLGSGSNSGVLSLNGFAQQIAGLTTSGSGTANRVVGGSTTLSSLTVTLTSSSQSFAGVLGGVGTNENNLAFIKSGAGTLTLTGTNTYTGTTTVNAGTLLVNGNQSAADGAVTVANGATLGGTGTLGGTTTVLSAGNLLAGVDGVGTLGFARSVTIESGGTVRAEINSATSDTLNLSGGTVARSLTLATGSNLNLEATTPTLGTTFTLANLGDAGLNFGSYAGGEGVIATYAANSTSPVNTHGVNVTLSGFDFSSGNQLVLRRTSSALVLEFSPVPEPATVLGVAVGLVAVGGLIRRTWKKVTTA